jgi:hypothetical protein
MKTVLGPVVTPVLVFAPLAFGQSDDALQPAAIDAETTRVLLYRSGEDAFPGHVATDRDRSAHRRGMEQLTVRQLYADYFSAQGLTPTQTDALVRALAEERTLTTSWSSGGAMHVPNDKDLRLAQSLRAEQEDMLGKERFAALVQYRDTLPERMQLQKLSDWLRVLGHPLTTEQKEALVAIVKSERYRLSSALVHAPKGTVEHATEVIETVDAFDGHVRALFDPILTPAQREIADRQFVERRERRHDALARYVRRRAEGDTQPFTYPVD